MTNESKSLAKSVSDFIVGEDWDSKDFLAAVLASILMIISGTGVAIYGMTIPNDFIVLFGQFIAVFGLFILSLCSVVIIASVFLCMAYAIFALFFEAIYRIIGFVSQFRITRKVRF